MSRGRAGRGGSRGRRGARGRLPGPAGTINVTVSPARHSLPLTLTFTRALAPPRDRGVPGSLPAHPGRVLTVAICIGGNFLPASSRRRRRPLLQPRAPRTLRPGFAPAGPPLPPRLSSRVSSPHSPLVSGARSGTSRRERGAGVCMHRPPSSCSARCTW